MCAMSEMQCAGVRPCDLQSAMCAMSKLQYPPRVRHIHVNMPNSHVSKEYVNKLFMQRFIDIKVVSDLFYEKKIS
jgi:coenzyme F420-reducing hydrogenase delta subunit